MVLLGVQYWTLSRRGFGTMYTEKEENKNKKIFV